MHICAKAEKLGAFRTPHESKPKFAFKYDDQVKELLRERRALRSKVHQTNLTELCRFEARKAKEKNQQEEAVDMNLF